MKIFKNYIFFLLTCMAISCTSEKSFKNLGEIYLGEQLALSVEIKDSIASIIISKTFFPSANTTSLEGKTENPEVWVISPTQEKNQLKSIDGLLFTSNLLNYEEGAFYKFTAKAHGFDPIESQKIEILKKPIIDSISSSEINKDNIRVSIFIKDQDLKKNYYFINLIKKEFWNGIPYELSFFYEVYGNKEIANKCYTTYLFTDECFNGTVFQLDFTIPVSQLYTYINNNEVALDSFDIIMGSVNEAFYENNLQEPDKEFTIDNETPELSFTNIINGQGFISSISTVRKTIYLK